MSTSQYPSSRESQQRVVRCGALNSTAMDGLLGRYRLTSVQIAPGMTIPGSYWGEPEAGLIGHRLYWQPDTPLHSLLHELAHFVCMDTLRRADLNTDAGGDDTEECAVCYLEVLLADYLPSFGTEGCLADMDAWGYSFREGSASAWFVGDGQEARVWLLDRGLIRADGSPTWRLRT